MSSRTFCLNFYLAPGDVTVLTALVRDLNLTYPEHRVFVDVSWPDLFFNNPHARHAAGIAQAYPNVEHLKLDYGQGIHGPQGQKTRTIHFLRWLYEDFYKKTGVNVPTLQPRGDFHFAPTEAEPLVSGRYWVLSAGGKSDFACKVWDATRFQAVADHLAALGLGVVQVGNTGTAGGIISANPKLSGVIDLVGKTSRRDLLRLIRDAEGVVCGVTFAMHVAAALEKPCVVVAGGREAWWWEAYVRENRGFMGGEKALRVPHRYLHTVGLLDCVGHHGGCWKRSLDPTGPMPCRKIAKGGAGPVAECMNLITVDHVLEACMSYYEDGTLPPISKPRPVGEVLAKLPVVEAIEATRAAQVGTLEGKDGIPVPPPPTPKSASFVPVTIGGYELEPTEFDMDETLDLPHAGRDPDFDNEIVGGKFTAFVLMYGDYPEMHRKCLGSLLATVPRDRIDVRVLSNALCTESVDYVNGFVADGRVSCHYRHLENAKKYPAMREAFHDRDVPIATNYVLWFDDDTTFDRDPNWLRLFARTITVGHPQGCRLFGPRYTYRLTPGQVAWIKAAPWYRGRPFQDPAGNESPTGDRSVFATGSCFALATDVIRQQDIPDSRLEHNGGDVMIGVQVAQGGWKMGAFDSKAKAIVNWSSYPRRGLSEPHPGQ